MGVAHIPIQAKAEDNPAEVIARLCRLLDESRAAHRKDLERHDAELRRLGLQLADAIALLKEAR